MEAWMAMAGFLWLIAGCSSAYLAVLLGRNAVGWGIVGFMFPPMIVVLWIIGAPLAPRIDEHGSRLCPFCAEPVKAAAIICRHCRSEIGA